MGLATCSSFCIFPFSNTSLNSRASLLYSFHRKTPFLNKVDDVNSGLSICDSFWCHHRNSAISFRRPRTAEDDDNDQQEEEKGDGKGQSSGKFQGIGIVVPIINQEFEKDGGNFGIVAACMVGLLTGVSVVIFNNGVHEIRDLFWDGIPSRGTSWLREEPFEETWKRVILVPTCGGVIVSILNIAGLALDTLSYPKLLPPNFKGALKSILKAVAASVTLGTGNSLGPEGPSVEIGASIGKGVTNVFDRSNQTSLSLSLRAAGSAAGISSGFNAAVAGCFFAVESVLWPSPGDSSPSLTNTTSMVILSAVIASVISEIGLGSEPAFKVPEYDFRSPSELPLYLLLGLLCGLVSLTLSRCTAYARNAADNVHKVLGVPKPLFPIMGGFSVGMIALAYPEVLYWGFENVDILLESRPFVEGLPAGLLLQLIGVKILATSLCRASGLVGGYYAPSLFIGAATGMAYGKLAGYAISQSDPTFHLSFLEVASPQAYGLVGMAATLAGVCQVPLTAVLLLFELTQDYRIVLPLLGAVGFSSLVASSQTRKRNVGDKNTSGEKDNDSKERKRSILNPDVLPSSNSSLAAEASDLTDLCELESSLCLDDYFTDLRRLEQRICVSQAMRTRYVSILMNTALTEAVSLMLAEKQSCALIVDNGNSLIGFVTLRDIQEFCKFATERNELSQVQKHQVAEICQMNNGKCGILWTATPEMDLLAARNIMNRQSLDQLPVVLKSTNDNTGYPVGLIDRECIDIVCRAVATQEFIALGKEP